MVSKAVENKRSPVMITKKILNPNRIRQICGGFSFIPHRFLTDGFLKSLSQHELLLYIFLILAADRNGLIKKDLIAFDGPLFQVLELPAVPKKLQRGTDGRSAHPAIH
jgi:hypothetical protein